jgi:hypothetical protein
MRVVHRGDGTLQKSAEKNPQDFQETDLMRKAIFEFVDAHLVNIKKEIVNIEELQEILNKWPEFAAGKFNDSSCVFSGMCARGGVITCSDGIYKLLVVGIIKYD